MTYTYNILGLQRFAAVESARVMGTLFVISKNVAIGRIERTQCWADKKAFFRHVQHGKVVLKQGLSD